MSGKAVQVEPMTSKLKAPRTVRLKVECDDLLSRFAFKFNLRRYKVAAGGPWWGGAG
jgi:hypothetical protein